MSAAPRKRRAAKQFTAEDIKRLLRKAKAKEPWKNPERCEETAKNLNLLLQEDPAEDPRAGIHELHTAALKFQKLLQKWVRPELDGWPLAKEVVQLDAALRTVFPSGSIPLKLAVAGSYPRVAYGLFNEYKVIIGSGGPYEGTPAMRFVVLTLAEAGLNVTEAAIHKALSGRASARFRKQGIEAQMHWLTFATLPVVPDMAPPVSRSPFANRDKS
jgi:hypothetical protein